MLAGRIDGWLSTKWTRARPSARARARARASTSCVGAGRRARLGECTKHIVNKSSRCTRSSRAGPSGARGPRAPSRSRGGGGGGRGSCCTPLSWDGGRPRRPCIDPSKAKGRCASTPPRRTIHVCGAAGRPPASTARTARRRRPRPRPWPPRVVVFCTGYRQRGRRFPRCAERAAAAAPLSEDDDPLPPAGPARRTASSTRPSRGSHSSASCAPTGAIGGWPSCRRCGGSRGCAGSCCSAPRPRPATRTATCCTSASRRRVDCARYIWPGTRGGGGGGGSWRRPRQLHAQVILSCANGFSIPP